MNKEEHKNYYRMVVDCWRFFLRHADPVSAEAYWENTLKDAAELGHKYNEHRLVCRLINAYLDYLEEKQKNTQKGNKYGS